MPNELLASEKQLKQLRMICFAIAAGGTIFCIVALVVGLGNTDISSVPGDLGSLRIVHLFLAVASLFSSRFIAEKVLAGKMQSAGQGSQPFFQRYQSSAIIQLASIEGLVLFGGVIVMLTPASVLQSDPTYFLHLTPLVLLILRAIQFAPTHDKLEMLSRAYQN